MFAIGLFSNPWVIFGPLAMIGLQLAFTYIPLMNAIFHSAPIPPRVWLPIIAAGLVVYLAVGTEKWITSRMRRR
jgi:Ca2+-transporting ATPase